MISYTDWCVWTPPRMLELPTMSAQRKYLYALEFRTTSPTINPTRGNMDVLGPTPSSSIPSGYWYVWNSYALNLLTCHLDIRSALTSQVALNIRITEMASFCLIVYVYCTGLVGEHIVELIGWLINWLIAGDLTATEGLLTSRADKIKQAFPYLSPLIIC